MQRGSFSSRLGFVAAAAGSAVGLGNIWRFPYETGSNGGAAFLLIYLVCILMIGYPVMIGEIAIGRNTRSNPYGAYTKLGNKSWGILGIWGIVCGVMFLSVYNVVAGWAFGYFLKISFGGLLTKSDFPGIFSDYIANPSDNFIYSFVFMAITAVIVSRGIQAGIEKASKILMPILFLLLISLIIYGLTLPNAMQGVKYYLVPDFGSITLKTVYTAMGQAFFSLSIGMGALITFGSYISKHDSIPKSAGLVTITDTLVAFLAGLMIFPFVGTIVNLSEGMPSDFQGPGLVFIILPEIFQNMGPVTGKLVGSTFFLLLCFAALTSTISLLEIPATLLVDQKGWNRKPIVWVSALVIFLIGVPSMLSHGAVDTFTNFLYYEGKSKSVFDFVFDVFSDTGLPLGGFLMMIFINRVWKVKSFNDEMSYGYPGYIRSKFKLFIDLMIKYVTPTVLGVMFVFTVLQKFFGISFF